MICYFTFFLIVKQGNKLGSIKKANEIASYLKDGGRIITGSHDNNYCVLKLSIDSN